MLRLSLVLALLAAIGALLVAQLKTKPDLEGVRTELASAKTSLDEAQKGKMASDKAAKEAKAAAEVAVRLSNDFKEKFEVAASDATTQKQRADKLASELETTMKSKNETQAELGRWVALGIKPDEIVRLKDEARRSIEEKIVAVEENKVLQRNLKQVKGRLAKYETPSLEVELPIGLHGTVTSIGPANDFVFLDIGANQGALERGRMMVRRGDKLVTKIQITSVAANHCVANILKDWNQGEISIQVGDVVIY